MRKTTRYFATPEEAVPLAKARAQSAIASKYVVHSRLLCEPQS